MGDEEMEETNRKASEGKKLVEKIAENLRQEFLIREAAHAEEMDRVRRDFEMERAELERQLKTATESKDEMAATAVDVARTMGNICVDAMIAKEADLAEKMAAKEKELAAKLAAAMEKLEEEKAEIEERVKVEWKAKKEEDDQAKEGEEKAKEG